MASKKRQGSRCDARCHTAFSVFVIVLAVLTLFGLTRVSLSARIAEASVDAGRLLEAICSERQVTDALEIDRGILTTPERLANIASVSMNMCEPSGLTYLEIEAPPDIFSFASETVSLTTALDDEGFTVKKMIAAVMDMAAGEAQVLLVGDAGLASSR